MPGLVKFLATILLFAGVWISIFISTAYSQNTQSGYWPSFRGPHASGVAEGQNLPDTWSGVTGENIKWTTKIPGLAHSSPIIWEEKVFVTTAVSSKGNATFKHGLYGSGEASADRSVHKWQILCLDKKSGEILWIETAKEAVPLDKRHIKATYANSTPATNGEIVVAMFGSEGLFAYNTEGEFLWRKDLGRLDVGAYDLPSYEWGGASSPIIYRDLVFVQCDSQGDDFILACDVKTGRTVWKTGPEYKLISSNEMGELLMATPAISGGTLCVKTKDHLFAICRSHRE